MLWTSPLCHLPNTTARHVTHVVAVRLMGTTAQAALVVVNIDHIVNVKISADVVVGRVSLIQLLA